jgi:hypothetical protein
MHDDASRATRTPPEPDRSLADQSRRVDRPISEHQDNPRRLPRVVRHHRYHASVCRAPRLWPPKRQDRLLALLRDERAPGRPPARCSLRATRSTLGLGDRRRSFAAGGSSVHVAGALVGDTFAKVLRSEDTRVHRASPLPQRVAQGRAAPVLEGPEGPRGGGDRLRPREGTRPRRQSRPARTPQRPAHLSGDRVRDGRVYRAESKDMSARIRSGRLLSAAEPAGGACLGLRARGRT